ncbi:MAG: hypothetical protein ABSH44_17270 [Bryobacteraceae bacterium]|jgi:membrane protein implicated in regulation of membrane protease activity
MSLETVLLMAVETPEKQYDTFWLKLIGYSLIAILLAIVVWRRRRKRKNDEDEV